MMREAMALAKMLPIWPRSQKVAVEVSTSMKTSMVNIDRLMKFTMKYFIQEVSMANEVIWEVSRAMRMSLAEQAFLTTWWFVSDEA